MEEKKYITENKNVWGGDFLYPFHPIPILVLHPVISNPPTTLCELSKIEQWRPHFRLLRIVESKKTVDRGNEKGSALTLPGQNKSHPWVKEPHQHPAVKSGCWDTFSSTSSQSLLKSREDRQWIFPLFGCPVLSDLKSDCIW